MHLTISEEIARQHGEELMHEVAIERLAKEARANTAASIRSLRNLHRELARYVGHFGNRLRKQSVT
jgi:hypothetical protein